MAVFAAQFLRRHLLAGVRLVVTRCVVRQGWRSLNTLELEFGRGIAAAGQRVARRLIGRDQPGGEQGEPAASFDPTAPILIDQLLFADCPADDSIDPAARLPYREAAAQSHHPTGRARRTIAPHSRTVP